MKKLTKEILETIKLCTDNNLIFCSSPTQIKRGTLKFKDKYVKHCYYTIHKNGYVRKYILGGYTGEEYVGYQLNKVIKTQSKWGGTNVERVLTPKEYLYMAETIVRIAQRTRKRERTYSGFKYVR